MKCKNGIWRYQGKTSAKSKNTWISKAYDRINLTVAKGKKDTIQAHAEAQGESVNGFINRVIDNQISQDRLRGSSEALESTKEGGAVYLYTFRSGENPGNGSEWRYSKGELNHGITSRERPLHLRRYARLG